MTLQAFVSMWLTKCSWQLWCSVFGSFTATTATPWCLPHSSVGCISLWNQKTRGMAYFLSSHCSWQPKKPTEAAGKGGSGLLQCMAGKFFCQQPWQADWLGSRQPGRGDFWEQHSCLLTCTRARFPQRFLLLAYRHPSSIFSWQGKTAANLRENLRRTKAAVV